MTQGLLRKMHKKNDKGFTLVELMIVVAIIGILAAIAIPQFAAYRTRGFNASGMSDVRNLNTSQAAYFSDWQVFGATALGQIANAAAADIAGTVLTGPGTVTTLITSNDASGTGRSLQIPLGNAVDIVASTGNTLTNVSMVGKHFQANTYYAADSDATAIYFVQGAAGVGSNVIAGDVPARTIADDFAGGAVAGPVAIGGTWAAK